MAIPATPNATTEVNSDAWRKADWARHLTERILTVEFGVGQATGRVQGVLVDDAGFAVCAERPIHIVACEAAGVVGHHDLLISKRVAHQNPGAKSGNDEEHTDHDGR